MIAIDNIVDENIRDCIRTLNLVASRRKLGVERWDNVLDICPNSGVVTVPVALGRRPFPEPFYFVFEKLDSQEFIFTRPVQGEQWSLGDVYGFFGLYDFDDFRIGEPIICVEGIADWAALKRYYKYVLCVNGAKCTVKQQYFLSSLTKEVWLGYDDDDSGNTAFKKATKALDRFGVSSIRLMPTKKDWGKMYEDEWGRKMLDRTMNSFLEHLLN